MLRAVVCDDDAMSRKLVGAVLERTGFEVMAELDSALDVANAVRVCHADVVVLDHAMTGITGTEAIPEIRAQAAGCAIVVFSAFEAAQAALHAGADSVVTKGDTPALEAALREIATTRGA